ncbi:MAG: extradiol ring-cleavage dioxygenase [Burkholderiaceae bacterium]
MGIVSGAAIVAHHPGLFRPEADRVALGNGRDSDLVQGFDRVRARMDMAGADTLVIIDTHWFTTLRHLVAGAERYSGVYTSPELPWIIADVPYDYRGAPELAREIERIGVSGGLPVTNATNPRIVPDYPTVNLLSKLWRGERILRVGICQNAACEHFLAMGAVIGEAIASVDCRAILLASGALSHRMIDLDFVPRHPCNWHPDNISDPAHVTLDHEIMALWAEGRHAEVIARYPEMRAAAYEGLGGHYLQMVGVLGGRRCAARGERLTDYENAVGTANAHIWFDVAGEAGNREIRS